MVVHFALFQCVVGYNLFPKYRALKTRGNTPKYGLIFHSTFIGRAAAKNKGRISRYLANKCTIASRIDCFAGETLSFMAVIISDGYFRNLVLIVNTQSDAGVWFSDQKK